ncbi:MAG: c-type cytochrome [Daejeonella sp.]|uniref:c-type cytochrome n=1 Tax=Daejeonella sp. JGW-45 TaxID=3034148 RepID=UPI0023EADF4D|nr:c-type cytochrome [Daejeonella sp. JGW-45]
MKINLKYFYRVATKTKLFVLAVLTCLITLSFVRSGGVGKLPDQSPKNGGLFLPGGFEAVVVADSVGRARHLAVNSNGDVYVKLRNPINKKGSIALRDTNKDGKADIIELFGDYRDEGNYGTAMRIHKGYLYFTTAGEVYRTKLTPGKLIPEGKTELLLTDDYKNAKYGSSHIAKPLAFDDEGNMYVPFGSPSDVCGIKDRQPGSLGQDPCPELQDHAGIWKFSDSKPNQTQKDGVRYATGIRSVVAMEWNKKEKALYAVQHGRDDFVRQFPDFYNPWQSALLPAEEFFKVTEGSDGGWPYAYYDYMQGKKLLNPEYGGDGKKVPTKKYMDPLVGFPGHFAPNDLFFYTGNQFPDRYKDGAFVAFHGSTIRSPYPQGGYFIGFVPMKNGLPSGDWEVFADGFPVVDTIINTSNALYRPMGIAMGPDGSLYFSESEKGKIWRVMYKGDKKKFSAADLTAMQKRKETQPHIKTPDIIKDNVNTAKIAAGAKLYNTYCASCHQVDGKGDGTRFPPLENSEWVKGDRRRLISIVLNGLSGPITVNGVGYNEVMPPANYLSDDQIALILTYVRANFKNNLTGVLPQEVARMRAMPKTP